jgi:putative transcriptional regulator
MAERDPPLNQKRLASETGLSPTTINQLYNNNFTRVDTRTVETLCNYFDRDVGELFTMREVPLEEMEGSPA